MKLVARLLGIAIGALLVYAGAQKISDPAGLAQEIGNYRFLPDLAPWLAAMLPSTEIVVGLALIVAPAGWRRAAGLGALCLLGAFTVAVSAALLRHINISCGCFGKGSSPITILTLVRNLALMAGATVTVAVRSDPA